ncbi:hypothetical protein VE25_03905 [Devosia geojensis]|uniref:PIN domain-containing protein n=1 Tax=Devosia geojensis TaxID=443610 RepID=A0A0F5FW57_9HYPH|nr:PIN domain-containing protein [Devosia geojensis]KKB13048.1 hypothetical protein VE25_03905 [Devosia geojensis]
MTAPFLDSNVLVYTISKDSRAERAYDLLRNGYVLGVQTLNEFANVARRKFELTWPEVSEASARLAVHASSIMPTEIEDHRRSFQIAERHRLSIYDSLMLAIALRADCTTFYSEDLHHGLVVEDRLTVLNPSAELSPYFNSHSCSAALWNFHVRCGPAITLR